MAPHRDERPSTPDDDRLRSLYTQRKASHRAPDALNQAVLDQARAPKRPGRWTGMVPPVAAAVVVMALGLQWLRDPAVTVLEERAADQAPPMEITSAPEFAGQSNEEASNFEAESRSQAPATAPSLQKQAPQASALSDSAGDRLLAEPMAEAEQTLTPRYLRAQPGETGVFEQCDGTRFEQVIDQAPAEGWFELTWSANDRIERVTPLPASPCEPDAP